MAYTYTLATYLASYATHTAHAASYAAEIAAEIAAPDTVDDFYAFATKFAGWTERENPSCMARHAAAHTKYAAEALANAIGVASR